MVVPQSVPSVLRVASLAMPQTRQVVARARPEGRVCPVLRPDVPYVRLAGNPSVYRKVERDVSRGQAEAFVAHTHRALQTVTGLYPRMLEAKLAGKFLDSGSFVTVEAGDGKQQFVLLRLQAFCASGIFATPQESGELITEFREDLVFGAGERASRWTPGLCNRHLNNLQEGRDVALITDRPV